MSKWPNWMRLIVVTSATAVFMAFIARMDSCQGSLVYVEEAECCGDSVQVDTVSITLLDTVYVPRTVYIHDTIEREGFRINFTDSLGSPMIPEGYDIM